MMFDNNKFKYYYFPTTNTNIKYELYKFKIHICKAL